MIIAVIGIYLFRNRYDHLRRFGDHSQEGHSHSHDHDHHNHGHGHSQDDQSHHHEIPDEVTFKNLFALGITGGMIPCPEALIVLLSAISLHRIGFGLILIVDFSIGLAFVLMIIGLLMVYARKYMERWSGEGKIIQALPVLSSIVITILGFVIVVQSLISGGIIELGTAGIIGKIL